MRPPSSTNNKITGNNVTTKQDDEPEHGVEHNTTEGLRTYQTAEDELLRREQQSGAAVISTTAPPTTHSQNIAGDAAETFASAGNAPEKVVQLEDKLVATGKIFNVSTAENGGIEQERPPAEFALPLTLQRNAGVTNSPGAFDVRPSNNNNNNNAEASGLGSLVFGIDGDSNIDDGEIHPLPFAPGDHPNPEGLAEAMPVDSMAFGLEHADPVDLEAMKARKKLMKEDASKNHSALLLAILIVVAITVAAVLAVTLTSSDSKSTSSAVTDNAATSAPAVPFEAIAAALKEATLARLPDFTVETITKDSKGVSPQSKALEWILQDPLISNYSDSRFRQRYGAATLYYATDGERWTHQGDENVTIGLETGSSFVMLDIAPEAPWLALSVHECGWYWTRSRNSKPVCTEDGTFEYLDLSRNELGGTLPPEIGIWEGLLGIRFGWHKMYGTIPTEVGMISNLKELRLNAGDLTGTLPTELLGLSNTLEAISLISNDIYGNFFEDFWQLTNLEQLQASRSGLYGSLPDTIGSQFPNMEKLVMSELSFTGSIPSSVGQWSLLEQFMMYDEPMMITGTIPTVFGDLTLLEELKIGSPLLSGSVPTELGRLTFLEELLFRHSPNLKGALPSELGLLNNTLESLILVNTSLTGTIPATLCGIETLEFDCSPSKLCGCDCPCAAIGNSTLGTLDAGNATAAAVEQNSDNAN